jgi:hypothetical protein
MLIYGTHEGVAYGIRTAGIFKRVWPAIAICFGLLLVTHRGAVAQTSYGSIAGTVNDSSGSVVPQANVTMTNLGTAERRAMETNKDGLYQFLNLVPGQYRIDVEKRGFKHFDRGPITVEVQNVVHINVGMEVGEVSQTVEVTSQTPLLQPETSSLGQVVESRKVNELPLNGRNPLALVALVPGVVPQGIVGGGSQQNAAGQNPFAAGNFQIGGGAANQSAAFLDGAPLNNAYYNILAITPTQDSIQEFKVQTNDLPAEYGRFAGGVINLATKSGTNTFHGTLYEFLRNKVLNANTFFNNAAGVKTPAFTQNQFGGSLAGPVTIPHLYNGRDKLFFFVNLEKYTQRLGISSVFTVPTVVETQGNFSGLRSANGALVPIYDPLTTVADPNNAGHYIRMPFGGNIIPTSRINPTAAYLANFRYWAAPNAAGNPVTNINNWVGNASAGTDSDQLTTRVDANISGKQEFFARYTLWLTDLHAVDPFGTHVYPIQYAPQKWHNQQAVINDTYSFSPTTIMDLRFAFMRQNVDQQPQGVGYDLTQLGWPAFMNQEVTFRVIPVITSISGLTPFFPESGTVILAKVPDYTITPSLSMIRGKHSIKLGGDFRIGQLNFVQDGGASGTFTFDQNFTTLDPLHPSGGFSFASFMLGYPAGGSAPQASPVASQKFYRALYFQDDIHANKTLTLNLGLRWELDGPFSERYNRLSDFNPHVPSPLAQPTGLPIMGALELVDSSARSSRTNFNPNYKNFAPRIGLAYQAMSHTVIRAGYGIFYLPGFQTGATGPDADAVNTYTTPMVTTTNGGLTPFNTLSNPFPSGVEPPPGRSSNYQSLLYGLGLSTVFPNDPSGYAQQWNFDIQQQLPGNVLVDAAYAGSRGVHLYFGTAVLDQLPLQDMALGSQLLASVPNPFYGLISNGTLAQPTVTYNQLLRPFPQYSAVNLIGRNGGDSEYQSLQLKLEKRMGSGGSLLLAYTASKLISDVDSSTAWLENGSALPQNWYNLSAERSLSEFDTPQRLVVSYVVDLPFGAGKKWLGGTKGLAGTLISGWGLDGVWTAQRGFPLYISASSNTSNSFGGTLRPNENGQDPALSGSAVSRLNKWFNTADFSQPAPFTFGNSPRTLPNVRAEGVDNFDFALFKSTLFGPEGKMGLQFRAEVFNLANRVQFGYPGMSFGTAQFGVVSSQVNQPRLIQLALRLSF